jgi:hypothetical protein
MADSVIGVVGVSDRIELVSLVKAAAEAGARPFVDLPVIDEGAGEFEPVAVEPPYGSSIPTVPGISKSPGPARIRLAGELFGSRTGSSLVWIDFRQGCQWSVSYKPRHNDNDSICPLCSPSRI